MQQLPTKELLKLIAKEPRSWIIYFLTGVTWYFIFKWSGTTVQMHSLCESEKAELRKELAVQQQINVQLLQNDRNQSDSMQRVLAKQVDSLLRDRLENKTKANLRNH